MEKEKNIISVKNETLFDFKNSLNPEVNISEIFFEFTEWYNSKYNINKSVLVLRSLTDLSLSAVSTWENGARRDGLTLRLPTESSLFEQVIGQGETYHSLMADVFSGNFFEKKLLLNESTRSFVLQPLKYKEEIIGLFGFSSETEDIFSEDRRSIFTETSMKLAEVIREKLISF